MIIFIAFVSCFTLCWVLLIFLWTLAFYLLSSKFHFTISLLLGNG